MKVLAACRSASIYFNGRLLISPMLTLCWNIKDFDSKLFFSKTEKHFFTSLTVVYKYDIKLLFNFFLMRWNQLKNRYYIAVRCCDVIPLYELFSYVPVLFATTKNLQGPLLVSAPRTTEWRHRDLIVVNFETVKRASNKDSSGVRDLKVLHTDKIDMQQIDVSKTLEISA